MRKKRILYLSRGGSIGGSQRQLLYLLQNLDRRIYEPFVVYLKEGQFADILRQLKVSSFFCPLHPWRKFKFCLHRHFDVLQLLRYARLNRISIVHSSDLWLSPYMLRVARRLNIPSVLHVRTPICQRDVDKQKCRYADKIIAISVRIVRNLVEAGINPDKIVQVDDGVDVELFKPQDDRDVLFRDLPVGTDFLVGIAGRISELKRQVDFLKAASLVSKTNSKGVRFLIIGPRYSESYFRKLEEYVKSNGLKGKVLFTGNRDDMPEVLSSLDILVSLSGGSVMFEAMSCGTPVISAGFTSPKDSVHIQNERTGLLVPSDSTSDLAAAMSRLIEDKALRRMTGRIARDWAVRNLHHQGMLRKTFQVYSRLLNKNGG